MIVYNVTVKLQPALSEEWLTWMKEVHIPDVMATGLFLEHKMYRILLDEEDGDSFAIQYMAASMADLQEYQAKHAQRLQAEHKARYGENGERYVAFRTLLESV